MDNDLQAWLTQLQQAAQANFEERDTIRDQVLRKSRELIRICSGAIRAGHREQWDEAHAQLAQANAMRRGEMKEAERLLNTMDAIYEMLMGFGYPDAISGGLRRRVDQLRGVLERTRGDLTNSLQMYRLWQALQTHSQETNPMEEHLTYE